MNKETAGNIVFAKGGVEYLIGLLVAFSRACFSTSHLFINLVSWKKHSLRLVEIELFVPFSPPFANTFPVSCNFMKTILQKITFCFVLISINIFGCKCEDLDIKQSFKYSEIVFIGKINDIKKAASGFKTLQNQLSNVKIEKIYKLDFYDDFYNENSFATIFSSQLRSCDIFFDNNKDYLIFGYIEPDTGFIYSEYCFKTKPLNEITKNELELLEKLKVEHQIDIEKANKNNETIVDLNYEGNVPNKQIERQKRDIDLLSEKNNFLKIIIYSISALFLILLIIIIVKKKNCR